jgi:hypothetical protein
VTAAAVAELVSYAVAVAIALVPALRVAVRREVRAALAEFCSSPGGTCPGLTRSNGGNTE